MDDVQTWHDATIRDLYNLLVADPAVETMALVGSGARGRLDAWSDLDVLLVVDPDAFARYFPALDWLAPLGRIYAYEQHRSSDDRGTTRICFDDLRRIDVVVTTADVLHRSDAGSVLPLADGASVVFSRSPSVHAVFSRAHAPAAPSVSDGAFQSLANGFWFKAIVAVQKVVRGDLLVALHLSLELTQECCVLAMMIRDRETGQTVHRGGAGNDLSTGIAPTPQPSGPHGVLDAIEHAATSFDRLAARWSFDYRPRREPLLVWVAAARWALTHGGQPREL